MVGSTLRSLILWGACLALATGARRARPPPGPKEPLPTVGDALDLKAENSYLGKDWQAVCVLTPGSGARRIVTKEGEVIGMRRRQGMVTWLKKHNHMPWAKPWDDPQTAPFKVRYMRLDPAGVALSMAHEKKLSLSAGEYEGKTIVSLSLAKPRAWYKFWPERKSE